MSKKLYNKVKHNKRTCICGELVITYKVLTEDVKEDLDSTICSKCNTKAGVYGIVDQIAYYSKQIEMNYNNLRKAISEHVKSL